MADNQKIGLQVSANATDAIAAMQNLAASVDLLCGKFKTLPGAMHGAAGESHNFAHAFQHFGAHEASKQLTELAGISGNARPLVMALTHTIMGLGGAFELLTGPVGIAIAAIGTLGGIYALTHHHAEDYTKSLEEMAKAQEATNPGAELAKVRAKIESDKEFITLEKEKKELAIWNLSHTPEGPLQFLRDRYTKAANAASEAIRTLTNDTKAQAAAESELQSKIGGESKFNLAHPSMNQDVRKDEDDSKFIESVREKNSKIAAMEADIQEQVTAVARTNRDRRIGLMHEEEAMWQQVGKQMINVGGAAINNVTSAMGQGFAKMIVQGKSFSDSFKNFFENLAEMVISMIVQMIAKWLIFMALSSFMSPVAGGALASMTGFHAALGADTMISTPTLFVAGESGPERVQVSPMYGGGSASQGNGGGGGGNTMIVINNHVNAAGVVTDLNAFADKMAQKTIVAIRGQGQLDMTRKS